MSADSGGEGGFGDHGAVQPTHRDVVDLEDLRAYLSDLSDTEEGYSGWQARRISPDGGPDGIDST